MFTTNMKEDISREVDLSKSLQLDNDDSFKQVLDFMYCGDLEINVDNSEDMLRIADFLLFEEIKEYCRQFYVVHGNLNLSNCLWLSVLTEHHNLTEIALLTRSILRSRFHDYFIHSDEILDLPASILCRLISDADITRFTTARSLAGAVIRWAEHNASSANSYEAMQHLVSSLSELSPAIIDECHHRMNAILTCESSLTLSRDESSQYNECFEYEDKPLSAAYNNLAY